METQVPQVPQQFSKTESNAAKVVKWSIAILLVLSVIAVVLAWNISMIRSVSESRDQFAKTAADRDLLESQLSAAQAQVIELQNRLSKSASGQLGVPVSVTMRTSLMGRGLVAVFTNRSTRTLTIIAKFTNPTTRKTVQQTVILNPGQFTEIGYQQGWEFASQDVIELSSAGYEPIKLSVN